MDNGKYTGAIFVDLKNSSVIARDLASCCAVCTAIVMWLEPIVFK